MPVVMWAYYAICVCFIGLLGWTFVREKKNVDEMLLYLIVLVPLVLRVLRIK